ARPRQMGGCRDRARARPNPATQGGRGKTREWMRLDARRWPWGSSRLANLRRAGRACLVSTGNPNLLTETATRSRAQADCGVLGRADSPSLTGYGGVMTENPPPPHQPQPPKPRGQFAKFLAFVEWLGNLLPHPVTLFALFAIGVMVISGITSALNLSVEDPRKVAVKNTFTVTGIEGDILSVKNKDENPLKLRVV